MSAKMFSEVYESAYRILGKRWMETLSIAGKDGTIKKRFRYKPAKKRAWMKTGPLKYVKNIGGYVKNRAGNYYSVVILVNTKRGRFRAVKLQNSIINWLAQTTKAPEDAGSKSVQKRAQQVLPGEKKELPHRSQESRETSGEYYIQVASVSSKPDRHYLSKIQKAGLRYQVLYEKRYKVLIGGYPSKKSAQEALPQVRRLLNKGAFIVTR